MPRIYQKIEQYIANDFWNEINRRCPDAGIKSGNNSALGRAVDLSGVTVGAYRKNPGKIRVDAIRNLVAVLKPDIRPVLRLLGYSEKEIRKFIKDNQN